jgi:hypothetical protein
MIEGQQHVVDRRAVGHGGVSHLAGSGRSSHETVDLSTIPAPKSSPAAPGGPAFPGQKGRISREASLQHSLQYRERRYGADSTRIPGSSLLKWLNSLYRPARPKGNPQGTPAPPLFQTAFGASPSGKAGDFDSPMRRFESSRPSQPVRRLETLPFVPSEMPANGGFLRIGYRSPDSKIGRCGSEIADSLRRIFEIFPFSGDSDRRPGSTETAWWARQLHVASGRKDFA